MKTLKARWSLRVLLITQAKLIQPERVRENEEGRMEDLRGAQGLNSWKEKEVRTRNLGQVWHSCLGCVTGKKMVTFQDGFSPRWGMLEKKQVRRVKEKTSTSIKGLVSHESSQSSVCVHVCVCVNSFSPKTVYIFPNILDLRACSILHLTSNICTCVFIKF